MSSPCRSPGRFPPSARGATSCASATWNRRGSGGRVLRRAPCHSHPRRVPEDDARHSGSRHRSVPRQDDRVQEGGRVISKPHRERLEKAGWKVGSAAEFLELSDVEAALVEAKLALGDAVRALRQRGRLSQQDLAKRMGVQPVARRQGREPRSRGIPRSPAPGDLCRPPGRAARLPPPGAEVVREPILGGDRQVAKGWPRLWSTRSSSLKCSTPSATPRRATADFLSGQGRPISRLALLVG